MATRVRHAARSCPGPWLVMPVGLEDEVLLCSYLRCVRCGTEVVDPSYEEVKEAHKQNRENFHGHGYTRG